jgi:D-beta-D-heptose 7-phosphate kinase/D-beta-D-heptose 1-phosphate adenosyltransferase
MTGAAFDLPREARDRIAEWRARGETIVFTNGVFDLLHRGHVEYLEETAALADRLVVAINDDASVRRLKGPERPILPEAERRELVTALRCVDLAVLFGEDTPARIIEQVAPDVLVKGGDWAIDKIVGREFVEARGGRVLTIPVRAGHSTTLLLERIRAGKSALDG